VQLELHRRTALEPGGGRRRCPSRHAAGRVGFFTGELLGFALSPDGSQVFIGTKETGVWSASASDLSFVSVNPKIQVQCLATRQTDAGMELWACGSEINDFIFGKSLDEGTSFQTMMATITSMAGPIACSATGSSVSIACETDANASQCTCAAYAQFCNGIESCNACLGCDQDGACADGGADEAGPATTPDSGDAGSSAVDAGNRTPPHGGSSTCGCSVVGGGSAAGFFAAWGIGALALRRRRRSANGKLTADELD
jgi:MYXO-CTERM domain-containing protein